MAEQNKDLGISRGDVVLWCLAGAMALILLFVADKIPEFASGGLVALFVLLAFPVQHLPFVRNAKTKRKLWLMRIVGIVVTAVAVGLFGMWVWPDVGLRILTEKQRDIFAAALKSEDHPAPIHLMCAPNDELDCSRAVQFVRIFGLAGWPLTSQTVDRVLPGQPKTGVYLVLHSTADIDYGKPEFRNPNVGVWTEMPHGYFQLKTAFKAIGVNLDQEAGTSFPQGTIGIYFGPGTVNLRQ